MTSKLKVFSWLLFDFANTSFSVVMVTFVFPLFFKNVICNGDPSGDAFWGSSVSLSMLLVALVSPVLGAEADYSGKRKKFLFLFTLVSVIATAFLSHSGPGTVFWAAALFILANMGFEGGLVFYDAYLKDIAPPEQVGRISGFGFATGYLGAFAILLLIKPLLGKGINVENIANIQTVIMVSALFFALFSLPLFLFLRDRGRVQGEERPGNADRANKGRQGMRDSGRGGATILVRSFSEVWYTIRHIMQYPDLSRFLLAFFFYNDAILTVIAFSSIYAQNTLGFTTGELIIFFMTVQTTAIAGSVIFGFVTDRIGPKRTIIITLGIWFVVIIAAIFTGSKQMFFYTGMLAGMSMGSSQAASRSMMTQLTPKEHVTEFFGFYDGTFGKASAIAGPLVFGMVSSYAGSQKAALASLLFFFATGLLLMLRVRFTGKNPVAAELSAGTVDA
ncbi:MAG: MFS transporter [Chlorobiaceae bacterium]|nr:MFS transporter [Chlorobiaceae bacterium]